MDMKSKVEMFQKMKKNKINQEEFIEWVEELERAAYIRGQYSVEESACWAIAE